MRTIEYAHTDDRVQLVSRCWEADSDGGTGSLFVGSICSLGRSLPLLVVVGGHCVLRGCECLVARSQLTDNLWSQLFYAERLKLLQFLDGARVMRDGPCLPLPSGLSLLGDVL